MRISTGNIAAFVGQELPDLIEVKLAARCQQDGIMVPQPMEGSEVPGQIGLFLYPVDGGALHPLGSTPTGKHKALFLPGRRLAGGVLIAPRPALFFLFQKGNLLFEDGPH